jgi:uncharacterized protein (DUF1778 family)
MSTKTERLEMRLSADHKALIERAAAVTGQPVTAFALSSLVERAEEILERHQQTLVSARDRRIFMAILEADDEPSPALVEAAKTLR